LSLRRPLSSCTDWIFIDADFAVDFNNWSTAPTFRTETITTFDLLDVDFVGVRYGDIDNSWNAPLFGAICLADTAAMEIGYTEGGQGDIVQVPLTVTGFNNIAGVEIHLAFPQEHLSFVDLSSMLSNPTVNQADGEIHLVWEDINNTLFLDQDELLLSVEFEIAESAPHITEIEFSAAYVANELGDHLVVIQENGYIVNSSTAITDSDQKLPEQFRLLQNYPNPFNASTIIRFEQPERSDVELSVYNLGGQKIATLIDGNLEPGYHKIQFNAEDYPSGLYFYSIRTNKNSQTRKMILLK